MKKLLLAGAAFIAFAGGAQAADLGVARAPVAAVVAVPVFNWSGVFVGAQIGYGWGKTDARFFNNVGVFIPAASGSYNINGVTGGVHLGYNMQFNNLVVGLVTDLEASGIRGTGLFPNGDDYRTRMNWQGSTRARLGVAVDRAHLYVTGGVAYAGIDYSAFNIGTATRIGSNSTRMGWTIGAGAEYAFTPNFIASLEYRYTDFGSRTVNLNPVFAGSTTYKTTTHTVRVGVSYLFSTGPSAVVARY
jgi:outer membrane immunogenic protein